ncbi:phosphotriesterase [Curtobacterium sp. MCBD17_034]|uniref:phosphotriesterase family protein n=1 Tax=unclassified Curtobacterium TaxID=257496 RepID=UPI000DA9D1E7|nr:MULTISPECIES: phosphotriesterase [unclassified Curtobacterium]PZF62060.1 phosphotriesterase [Curtobacterium sp. MCBD17_034]PZM34007.1 phosphotriesterase [Curtobacterium sp. MCBD17_031]
MTSERPGGTAPVTVHTVTGEVGSDELGFTLPHEHLLNSIEAGGITPDPAFPELFDQPVTPDLAWLLRDHPYACRDNCALDHPDDVAPELDHFASLGGTTLVEVTSEGQGRDRSGLAALSRRTGVQIIAGGGWYLERFHPERTATDPVDVLAEYLLSDHREDRDPSEPRSGVIGEIGVSPAFTKREEQGLRAACRVQRETGLPMYIHLPGFVRHGGRVLDVVLTEEGVPPAAVVLCHVDPSGEDPDYQRSLADRGVFLEFDMIGMPYRFTLPGEGDSPSVAQTARAIGRLVTDGFGERLLFSHDLFLKGMLRKNGGNGLAFIPAVFLQRLIDDGLDAHTVLGVNTRNVRALFELAAASTSH